MERLIRPSSCSISAANFVLPPNLPNRNVGINRSAGVNFVQEEVILSLGCYSLLGFTYSLQPLGGQGGDMRVMIRN